MRHEARYEYKMKEGPARAVVKVALFMLLIGAAIFFFMPDKISNMGRQTIASAAEVPSRSVPNGQVIMYSLSYCPVCAGMRKDFHEAGISYTEYLIDKDPTVKAALDHRLKKYNTAGNTVGTPVLFVGDVMYMGRAKIDDIKKDLR